MSLKYKPFVAIKPLFVGYGMNGIPIFCFKISNYNCNLVKKNTFQIKLSIYVGYWIDSCCLLNAFHCYLIVHVLSFAQPCTQMIPLRNETTFYWFIIFSKFRAQFSPLDCLELFLEWYRYCEAFHVFSSIEKCGLWLHRTYRGKWNDQGRATKINMHCLKRMCWIVW